jgi:hypothetical protein
METVGSVRVEESSFLAAATFDNQQQGGHTLAGGIFSGLLWQGGPYMEGSWSFALVLLLLPMWALKGCWGLKASLLPLWAFECNGSRVCRCVQVHSRDAYRCRHQVHQVVQMALLHLLYASVCPDRSCTAWYPVAMLFSGVVAGLAGLTICFLSGHRPVEFAAYECFRITRRSCELHHVGLTCWLGCRQLPVSSCLGCCQQLQRSVLTEGSIIWAILHSTCCAGPFQGYQASSTCGVLPRTCCDA